MKNLHRLVFVLTATLMAGAALAQGNERQISGIDISGSWYNAGGNGGDGMPILAEYGGMPLNESARLYALAWSPARMTVRQQQCAAYDPSRQLHGGGNYRFWDERDPVTQRLIAIHIYGQITEAQRTIWMDGRPHPPAYAKHTWLGFSTGRYEGNVFTVDTTHLKRAWLRSNGVPQSDQATLVEHFVRHGDRITYMTVLTDPVNLTEPYVRSTNQFRSVRQPEAWLYACDDGEQDVGRRDDEIPSYLFGQNPYLREYADKNRIPLAASLGGAETMYPEYITKVKTVADAEAMARTRPSTDGPPITSRAVDPEPHDGEIHAWAVQGNVHLLIGAGGNIAVQVGENGALVVDTGTDKLADSFVHFRRSDVIVTGDLFTTTQYPVIDIKNGGSVHGLIDALNAILDKTVYKHEEEGGTLIIPGHGRICDEYEVGEYRDMIAIIRDRVQAMINQGATVEQVKGARLTADFDSRYGAVTGPWTTDMFVEAVYTSLKQGRPKAGATK